MSGDRVKWSVSDLGKARQSGGDSDSSVNISLIRLKPLAVSAQVQTLRHSKSENKVRFPL